MLAPRPLVRALAALLVLAGVARSAPADVMLLTFEEAAGWPTVVVPDGYGGLEWENFLTGRRTVEPAGSGFVTGAVSGEFVAFNAYERPAEIRSSGFTFDLESAYLTAAWNHDLNLRVDGYREGVALYSQTVVLDTAAPLRVSFDFLGVDRVRFTSWGGTDANPGDRGSGAHFVLDGLAAEGLPPGSAAPEPASLALLGGGVLLLAGRGRRR